MIKVGLTGGYATGKSFVAAELQRLGCHVIYADQLGHQVLEPKGEAYQPVMEMFGQSVLGEDQRIDRKKLGALVFTSPELLEKLTSIVHPAVFRLEEQMLDQFKAAHPQEIVVIEAAILIETGRDKLFDRIILTVCDEKTQIARGMKRDGLSADEVRTRLRRQMPLEEKQKYADYMIDTGHEKTETIRQTQAVYRDLKTLIST